MPPPRYRDSVPAGLFIAVEGLDGAGTTSQCRLLADWLTERDLEVELTHEPSTGPLGILLRSALEQRITLESTTMALAFAADRADHLRNETNGIEKVLREGRWVVCDRYVLSSLAYQAAQGEDLDWLISLNRAARVPDLTVFVDTPPDVCLSRLSRRSRKEEVFHDSRMLLSVQNRYREVLGRTVFLSGLVTADGSEAIESVQKQVRDGICSWLEWHDPLWAARLAGARWE